MRRRSWSERLRVSGLVWTPLTTYWQFLHRLDLRFVFENPSLLAFCSNPCPQLQNRPLDIIGSLGETGDRIILSVVTHSACHKCGNDTHCLASAQCSYSTICFHTSIGKVDLPQVRMPLWLRLLYLFVRCNMSSEAYVVDRFADLFCERTKSA